jgi:hypothetical protein
MLNLCDIVAAILKMATGRHFSMSGINSGHHNQIDHHSKLCSLFLKFSKLPRFQNGRQHKNKKNQNKLLKNQISKEM